MRVEKRDRLGDGMSEKVWPIRNREMSISSCRDEQFEEDLEVGVFLIERSLVRG